MKKANEFIVETKVNYSDDTGCAFEKRFVFRHDDTYQEFMQECDKFFGFIRASYGADKFDELMKKNEEKEEVAIDNVTPIKKKTVVTDKEV